MNILHIVPTGGWAGTETIVSGLANYQVREHRTAVALSTTSAFPLRFYTEKFDPRVELFAFSEKHVTAQRRAAALDAQFGWRPDIIHAHLGPGSRVADGLRHWNSIRVASMHIRYYSLHFQHMDAVIAITPWQLGDVPPSYAGKTFLVNNFVPVPPKQKSDAGRWFRASLHVDDDAFVIGSIGRLHLEKGFDILIRAFKRADLENAKLVIIGEGNHRPRLEALAKGHPDIILHGFLNNASRVIPAMDLYVSATRSEPFGLTLVEAMHHRRPIVSTAAFGPRDIFVERPEILVPMDDVDALAAKLREHCDRGRVGPVEYDLRRFDYETCNQNMLGVYEQLCSDPELSRRLQAPRAFGMSERTLRRLRGLRARIGALRPAPSV